MSSTSTNQSRDPSKRSKRPFSPQRLAFVAVVVGALAGVFCGAWMAVAS